MKRLALLVLLIATAAYGQTSNPMIWNGPNAYDLSSGGVRTGHLLLPEAGDVTGTQYWTLQSPSLSSNQTLILPEASANTDEVFVATGATTTDFAKIVDANVDNAAALARSKLASGSNGHVVINSGAGVMSSEAQLALTRGGTAKSLTASAGAMCYSDSDSLELNTPGTASMWTLSGGTGAPTFSNTTTTAKTIAGSVAGDVQLTVRGATSQSTNIFLAENVGGTDLFAVDQAGNVTATANLTTLAATSVDYVDVARQTTSAVFIGVSALSANGRVGFFYTDTASSVSCNTECVNDETAHSFTNGSGGCLAAYNRSNANVLTCADATAVAKHCLCTGAIQN